MIPKKNSSPRKRCRKVCGSMEICWENLRVQSFCEAGLMTSNNGLVITLPDGSEFQLTIVQSR